MADKANRRRGLDRGGTRPFLGAADIDAELNDEALVIQPKEEEEVPRSSNGVRRRKRPVADDDEDISILKRTLQQVGGNRVVHFFIVFPKFLFVATFRITEVMILLLLELVSKIMPNKMIESMNAYRNTIIRLTTWFTILMFTTLIVYSALFSNGRRDIYEGIETIQPPRDLPSLPPPRRPPHPEDLSEEIKRLEYDTRSIWLEISDHHSHLKSIKQSLDFIMFNQDTQKDLLATLDLSSEQVSELILQILQNASFWNNFFQQVQEYTATTDYTTTTTTAATSIAKDSAAPQDHPADEENNTQQHKTREAKPLMELLSKTINDIVHKNMIESVNSAITKYHHENLIPLLPKIITDVVESELTKYHQDVINTADFALGTRGGRIIHSVTSSTYHVLPAWLQSLRYAAAFRDGFSKPEMAIFYDIHAGQCWSMCGSNGTLGILLSETIQVKAITVEHASKEVLKDKIHHAPKEMELFGISKYPSSLENLVSLLKFEYAIHAEKHLQTFEVTPAQITEEGVTEKEDDSRSDCAEANVFKAVVLKVYSNWGHGEHTDIYRIRIHGEPIIQQG